MTPAAILFLAGCAVVTASEGPSLSPQAAALVKPILTTRFAAHAEEYDSAGRYRGRSSHSDAFDKHLGNLLQARNKAADEAIAALMAFYVGEGPGNELICQARKRGQRMTPFLRRFLDQPPVTGLEPIDPFFLDIPNHRRTALAHIEAGDDPGNCE
jgi:hypothetical protein